MAFAMLLLTVGIGVFIAWRGHVEAARELTIETAIAADPKPETTIQSPEIYLLLDVSASLVRHAGGPGTDPGNRQLQAVQTLLTLGRHFSSPHAGGFAPRFGILTFASNAEWIKVGGQTSWTLHSDAALREALVAIDARMGGTGPADRRRGNFTDWNSAFVALAAALERSTTPPESRIALLMTDGLHHAFPGNLHDYPPDRQTECEAFRGELAETLLDLLVEHRASLGSVSASLEARVREQISRGVEPIEWLEKERGSAGEIGQKLRDDPKIIAAARTVLDWVEQRASITTLAAQQMISRHLPALRGQAQFGVVSLSPMSRREAETLPERHEQRQMLSELLGILAALDTSADSLHWCNDRGLAAEFTSLISRPLHLIRVPQHPLLPDEQFLLGGRVQGLAMLVVGGSADDEVEANHERLTAPDGRVLSVTTELSGARLYLIANPASGTYRLAPPAQGHASGMWLIQTNPLFRLTGNHVASLLDPAPAIRLEAFDALSTIPRSLGEILARPPELLNGSLVRLDSTPDEQAERDCAISLSVDRQRYELRGEFDPEVLRRVGRYEFRVRLDDLRFDDPGEPPLTPQELTWDLAVEPALRVTILSVDGTPVREIVFPRQWARVRVGGSDAR
jgi:hypothetical protein